MPRPKRSVRRPLLDRRGTAMERRYRFNADHVPFGRVGL